MTNESKSLHRKTHSIIDFAALKTAIVNGETERVKALLNEQKLQVLEKDYLIDLAKMNSNGTIIKMIKNAPTRG